MRNTTTNPADFANRLQTFFNPKLLQALDYNLILAQYGESKDYPAKGSSIRFFRPRASNRAGVVALTEGTGTATVTEVAVGYVDVPLSQRGAKSEITDIVEAIDLLDTVKTHTMTMGGDAALDFDSVIRDALITGLNASNNTYKSGPSGLRQAYFERFAGIANTGVSANDFAALVAEGAAASTMTRARHLTNVTQLKDARVPKIGGKYVCVTSAAVMSDIRKDGDWLKAAQEVDNQALYKNAEIMLDGCVFAEQDNSFIEDEVYGAYDDVDDNGSGLIYSSIYLGAQAFGVPKLTNTRAGGSQKGPKITVLSSADKTDPHNLLTVIAWKAFYGCKPFITSVAGDVPHYLVFRSKSSFQ